MTITGSIDSGGSARSYDEYINRLSRLVARDFIKWLDLAKGLEWLDVGCSTGDLTNVILERANPHAVLGIDPSAEILERARQNVRDARAGFQTGNVKSLGVADATFDVAVSGLYLHSVPDEPAAFLAMTRAVKPKGWVGLYVWDPGSKMQMIRKFWDAAVELDPAAQKLHETMFSPMCRLGALMDLFARADFGTIFSRAIDVPTEFGSFEELWFLFMNGAAPAPRYCQSLDPEKRARLCEKLRRTTGTRADGSIHLVARAWAVAGQVPRV